MENNAICSSLSCRVYRWFTGLLPGGDAPSASLTPAPSLSPDNVPTHLNPNDPLNTNNVTITEVAPPPSLEDFSRELSAAHVEIDTFLSQAKISLSHGCIHMDTMTPDRMNKLGVGVGTKVKLHGYNERLKWPFPPLLSGEIYKNDKKYPSTALRIDVYPGQEIAVISNNQGERLCYFAVQGGPRYKRTSSNRNPAVPTSRQATLEIGGNGVKSYSARYIYSNIPGGAEIKFDYGKKQVFSRVSEQSPWQEFIANTPGRKRLKNELLSDNDIRDSVLVTRTILINGEATDKTYYMGNDFGNGFPQNTPDQIGAYQAQRVYGLKDEQLFFHTSGRDENQRRISLDTIVYALVVEDESKVVYPDKQWQQNHASQNLYAVLTTIGRNWNFDPKTKALDLSPLKNVLLKSQLGEDPEQAELLWQALRGKEYIDRNGIIQKAFYECKKENFKITIEFEEKALALEPEENETLFALLQNGAYSYAQDILRSAFLLPQNKKDAIAMERLETHVIRALNDERLSAYLRGDEFKTLRGKCQAYFKGQDIPLDVKKLALTSVLENNYTSEADAQKILGTTLALNSVVISKNETIITSDPNAFSWTEFPLAGKDSIATVFPEGEDNNGGYRVELSFNTGSFLKGRKGFEFSDQEAIENLYAGFVKLIKELKGKKEFTPYIPYINSSIDIEEFKQRLMQSCVDHENGKIPEMVEHKEVFLDLN